MKQKQSLNASKQFLKRIVDNNKKPRHMARFFIVSRKPRDSRVVQKRLTDEQKANKKSVQNFLMSKAPLCKATSRCRVCNANIEELSAKLTEGLCSTDFCFYNPSVIFLRKCHLPLHKGGLVLVPLGRVYVTSAWLAGQ